MTPATIHCPERVAPATLAAWRDGALSVAEAAHVTAHVTAHVPACSACRAVLSSYDMLDDVLRRQPAPEPDERLWRAVQRGMHGTRRMRRASKPAQRLGGGLAALAAVVLLALGFAQVLHNRAVATVHTSATATTAPQGTPTLLPTAAPASPATNGPRPSWQQAQLPVAGLTDQDILTYAVVPGHGESAYACHAISDRAGGTLTFYHTTDRALHWATLTQLKEPGVDVSDCMVQVDALDGNRILIQAQGQTMQTLKEVVWYELSEDGGATWIRLDESATIYGVSTWSGHSYALHLQVTDPQHATLRLSVSTDHLHTWQPVDQSLVSPYQGVTNFWLSPSGELLAEVTTWRGTPPSATPTSRLAARQKESVALWRSSDGGAHWALFPAPALSSGQTLPPFVVGQPVAGEPWHICMQYLTQTSAVANLACTFDGGRTWSARPLLCTAAPCGQASLAGSYYYLASDGTVILMDLAPGSDFQFGLYRLPRGSTTWQFLGPISGSNAFFFAPTPNGGILWAYAGGTFAEARLSGSIGGHQALPGVLSTASYP